jgi:hypothetical protein
MRMKTFHVATPAKLLAKPPFSAITRTTPLNITFLQQNEHSSRHLRPMQIQLAGELSLIYQPPSTPIENSSQRQQHAQCRARAKLLHRLINRTMEQDHEPPSETLIRPTPLFHINNLAMLGYQRKHPHGLRKFCHSSSPSTSMSTIMTITFRFASKNHQKSKTSYS